MARIQEGVVVARKSYGGDIFFKVCSIFTGPDGKEYARLKGLDIRLEATSLVDDLIRVDAARVSAYWHACTMKNLERQKVVLQRREMDRQRGMKRATGGNFSDIESFDMPGTLVHIDGDKDYLDLCMVTYKQLNINCHGYYIDEEKQADQLMGILTEHRPDMLVLTGHDGLVKGARDYRDISNYHNSKHFIRSVNVARTYEKSRDDLVIFAGACQSHYEALLEAGANFASSPKRVLIHAYDPVFVMEKVAYTSIYEPIALKDVIAGTITGFDGIGGLERKKVHSDMVT